MNEFKKLGEDVFISDLAIIKNKHLIEIGNHVAIDNGVTVSTQLVLGDYIHVSPHVCFIGGKTSKVVVGDFVFLAAGTKIVAGSENYLGTGLVGATIPVELRDLIIKDVVFERFSGCGVNCSIMPGVTMAEGSVLGANSLLLHDTEPWTVYVGSPAKPIKIREKDIIIENAKKLGYIYG